MNLPNIQAPGPSTWEKQALPPPLSHIHKPHFAQIPSHYFLFKPSSLQWFLSSLPGHPRGGREAQPARRQATFRSLSPRVLWLSWPRTIRAEPTPAASRHNLRAPFSPPWGPETPTALTQDVKSFLGSPALSSQLSAPRGVINVIKGFPITILAAP